MKSCTMTAMAAFALAACQTAAGDGVENEQAVSPLEAPFSGEACPDIGNRAYFFWMEPRSAEPGDMIALTPYWTDMPGGYNRLPSGCLDDLGVYPEGAATFERQEDGLAIATISESVEPGTRVRLDGTYRGHGLSGQVEVYRKEVNPLVGTWRQLEENCPAESAVRELVFTGGDEMTVTWTPFEVYKDYWADYSYDPATGAFRFEVEGGNQVPDDLVSEGRVSVDSDELVFDGVFLGTPRQAESGCRAAFTR